MCSICFVNAWAAVQVSPQFARPSCSSIAVHFSVSVCVLIFIRQGMGGSAGKSSFCMDHLQLFRCAFRVYVCICVCDFVRSDSSTHGRQRRLVLILHGPPAAHLLCIPCVCVYVYVCVYMCSICFVNAWAAVQISPRFARPTGSSVAGQNDY